MSIRFLKSIFSIKAYRLKRNKEALLLLIVQDLRLAVFLADLGGLEFKVPRNDVRSVKSILLVGGYTTNQITKNVIKGYIDKVDHIISDCYHAGDYWYEEAAETILHDLSEKVVYDLKVDS